MVKTELKYDCSFCGSKTNFKDGDNAYCIDCYCKLRNSAHVHLNHPQITSMPQIGRGLPGTTTTTLPGFGGVIC